MASGAPGGLGPRGAWRLIKALRAIRRAVESLRPCGRVAFTPWLLALSFALASETTDTSNNERKQERRRTQAKTNASKKQTRNASNKERKQDKRHASKRRTQARSKRRTRATTNARKRKRTQGERTQAKKRTQATRSPKSEARQEAPGEHRKITKVSKVLKNEAPGSLERFSGVGCIISNSWRASGGQPGTKNQAFYVGGVKEISFGRRFGLQCKVHKCWAGYMKSFIFLQK